MIEANRHPGITALARAGLAALTLVAAGDLNPAYADSQRGNKAVAKYDNMVAKGVEQIDPEADRLCPPETWKITEKTVQPVTRCYDRRYSNIQDCHTTGYYNFSIRCEAK